jgi:menaquinone-dependent protoporphyrinogen oxidase
MAELPDRERALVAYATKRGSTREVAEAIAGTLRELGLTVELRSAGEVEDVEPYDAVVLGGAIYMGRLHEDARKLLTRHRDALAARRLAVFGMGPRTISEDDIAGSRAQLEKSLAHASVDPDLTAIFGGVVDPAKLRFPFNRLDASDARDWKAIHAWAREVADAVRLTPVAP